jgi:hypothetical protein
VARVTFDFGLNETESTAPNECESGYNFKLQLDSKHLAPRKAIDLKGSVPNGGYVNGLMQLVTTDNVETTLVYGGGSVTTPAIYSWTGSNTSTAFTSVRTTNLDSDSMLRGTFWALDDYLTITDIKKLTPILNWNGTTLSRHKTALTSGNALSTTLACSGGTVTATAAAHGYSVGDLVTIAGADDSTFNGEYEVASVPTTTAFTYTITSCPTTTATGTITSDKGVELFAKYSIVHNNRLWLFNVKTDSDDNPHMILASKFEEPTSFDTVNRSGIASGNAAFYTLTPDLKAINGVSVFNKQLIISTVDGALHRLSGLDAADYQFTTYYGGSHAVGDESIANIGNDVTFMKKGGNIDLLSATDTSGDVRTDDISRYLPDTTENLTGADIVYDQHEQTVYYFLSDKILVLFKDILNSGGGSPWGMYKTKLKNTVDSTNIFDSNAILYMRRPQETTLTVYFGDKDGNIYDLTGSGTGDNGTDIVVSRKTALIESSRLNILQGYVHYRRLGEMNMSLIFDWANEYNETQSDITLKGAPSTQADPTYYGGGYYYSEADNFYNEGFAFAEKKSRQNFSPAGRSEGFNMEFYTETTVQFQIDYIALME